MESSERLSWDQYFMSSAMLASKRSTCIRRQVGAVIAKDNQILATGYNGAPRGLVHCNAVGCLREKLKVSSGSMHELCRGVHAEQNAIVLAAKKGISVEGASIYTTEKPCCICVKLIINAGIREIFFVNDYEDKTSDNLIKESGLRMTRINKDSLCSIEDPKY